MIKIWLFYSLYVSKVKVRGITHHDKFQVKIPTGILIILTLNFVYRINASNKLGLSCNDGEDGENSEDMPKRSREQGLIALLHTKKCDVSLSPWRHFLFMTTRSNSQSSVPVIFESGNGGKKTRLEYEIQG